MGAQLGYDSEGRLASWQNAPGSSPTSSASFLYDGEGNRVAQVATSGGATTTTAYVGSLEEVTTSGGTTTTTAYYGGIALSVNGALSYTLADGLGSVSESVNTNGAVTATQLYSPYGAVRYQSGTLPTDYGFTHQHADAATSGLDDDGARFYDPVAGQFTSADTTLAGGLNRYAYVAGNPESATDPSGQSPIENSAGVEGMVAVEETDSWIDRVLLEAQQTIADGVPQTTLTESGYTYTGNPDGSLAVTQTSSDGVFVQTATYGPSDPQFGTQLTNFVTAMDEANTSTMARASDVRRQNNALTAENDRPTPTPSVPSDSSGGASGADEGAATESAPPLATGGAGAHQGGYGGTILRHYTSAEGYNAILTSGVLNVSTKAANPKDARYGDGVYLTDVGPEDGLRRGQVSHLLWGVPWSGHKLDYYLDINVEGLGAREVNAHNFLIETDSPLEIIERLEGGGPVEWP